MSNFKKYLSILLIIFSLIIANLGSSIHFAFAEDQNFTTTTDESSISDTLTDAINKSANLILSTGISSDWKAFALARSGTSLSKEKKLEYLSTVESYVRKGNLSFTDYARTIIGIVSVGGDPTNFADTNLIEKLYQSNLGAINGNIFALIALDLKNYAIPADATLQREALIRSILSVQHTDGGWSLSSNLASASDPDMTGMAMTALSKYNNRPEIRTAIQKAATYFSNTQTSLGGFKSYGTENSNSIAQVLMGLTTNGIDPTGPEFTKNGNTVVSALLSYQFPDGGFKWMLTDTKNNAMAMEQALYALDQYKFFLENRGSIYDFVQNPVEELNKPIDTTSLLAKISEVEKMQQGNYTDQSWEALQIALSTAKEIVSNKQVTQEEIDNALTELETAFYNLKVNDTPSPVDNTTLLAKISEVEKMQQGNYTNQSWEALQIALSTAKEIVSNKQVTQEEIDNALTDLETAFNNLKVNDIPSPVDKTDLLAKISEVEKMQQGNYTISSWQALQVALAKAKNVAEDLSATEEQVSNAITDLNNAIKGLISEKITVSFSVIGNSQNANKHVNLSTVRMTVENGKTAAYVIEKALNDHNITYINKGGNYISMIGGLSEFDGGPNSGWLYTVNGKYPNIGVGQYILSNNDTITMIYTDDYTNIDWGNEVTPPDDNGPTSPNPEFTKEIKAGIQKGFNKIISSNTLFSDWEALAAMRSGYSVSEKMKNQRLDTIISYLKQQKKLSATDYARTIIGIVSIGGDPQNIADRDLIKEISQLNITSINGKTFALIALDSKNYKIAQNAPLQRETLVKDIIAMQHKDGGWSLSSNLDSSSDPDVTGMAMTALSKYNQQPAVKDSITKAVQYLRKTQTKNGGYSSMGQENSNSAAQVIMGLTTNGIDPTGNDFTKNGKNVIQALLSYQLKDGGFKWISSDTENNGMALEQSVYALDQYQFYLEGKGSIYDWVKNPVKQLTPGGTVIDKTPPTLSVNQVSDRSTKITGKTEAKATVKLYIDGKLKKTTTADAKGNFSFTISKQKAGVKLKLTASNKAGNSTSKTITIVDKTPPTLSVNQVSDKSTKVTGKTEAKATIKLYINGKLKKTTTADAKGKFSFTISKQKAGVKLKVMASDKAGNSTSKTITIVDKTPPTLSVNQVSDKSTKVTGKTEAKATIKLYIKGKLKKTTTADVKGKFSFTISKQKAGVKLKVFASDKAGNSTSKTITIVDKTSPKKPTVKKVTIKSKVVNGKAEAKATVYVYKGKKKLGSALADSKGRFKVKIKKQRAETKLSVFVKDKAKNQSKSTKITVSKK